MPVTYYFFENWFIELIEYLLLIEYEYSIENNEGKLNDLQKKVDDLNNQMKNHLDHIEQRAKYYRECQA